MPSALAWKDAMDDRRGPRDVATPIRGGLRGQTVTKTEQQTNDCHAKGAGEWQKDDPWQKGDPWKEAMDSRKPSSSAVTPRGRVQGQAAATDEHTVDSQSARNDEWHKDNPLQKDSLWKKAMDSRMPSRCALTQRGGIRGQAAAKDEQPADSQITSNDEWHKDDWQGSGTDWQTGGGGWENSWSGSGSWSSDAWQGSKSDPATAKSDPATAKSAAPKMATDSGAHKMLGRAMQLANARESRGMTPRGGIRGAAPPPVAARQPESSSVAKAAAPVQAKATPAPSPATTSAVGGYSGGEKTASTPAASSSVEKLVKFLLAKPDQIDQREKMLRTLAATGKSIGDGIVLDAASVDEAARRAKQQAQPQPAPSPAERKVSQKDASSAGEKGWNDDTSWKDEAWKGSDNSWGEDPAWSSDRGKGGNKWWESSEKWWETSDTANGYDAKDSSDNWWESSGEGKSGASSHQSKWDQNARQTSSSNSWAGTNGDHGKWETDQQAASTTSSSRSAPSGKAVAAANSSSQSPAAAAPAQASAPAMPDDEAVVARCVEYLKRAADVEKAKKTMLHPSSSVPSEVARKAISIFEAAQLGGQLDGSGARFQ
eukprot:gnl/TRDRNA2_/TRDRNA2_157782_c1_seq6.p1 gnl/TRDRNA2_/TRDRNA2_157782_c1~~gnl/TRDRNA2_/TRDRNA2_157782_c1_seq6.p1  ORF type:complete len:610 (+),score=127.54 gnl/TRDRNA2_/TRDRNA2_157782_c1_seq6:38-1831(+)